MNRTYKTVFNHRLNVWQAVAETARGKGKTGGGLRIATGLAIALTSPALWACSGWGGNVLVTGGTVQNTSSSSALDCGDTATVTGANSQWNIQGDLTIGVTAGTSTMDVKSGGLVSNTGYGYIGYNSGSTGTVSVDGSGSTWTNSGGLYVGTNGVGVLNITSGASVGSDFGRVGNNAGSNGTVTVDGSGSTWTNASSVVVGVSGTGTLNIQNGATVTSVGGVIGSIAGSNGTVTVDGSGSTWTNSSGLYVGTNGVGTLTIQNGGSLTASSTQLGFTSGNATINLDGTSGARGVLETGTVIKGSGSATFNWNGGVLRATGNNSNFITGFATGDIKVQSGGAFIDTNGYNVSTDTSSILSGTGGLTKQGTGTLTMSGANTYTGGTTISAGTLALAGSGALASTGAVDIASGATFQLSAATGNRTIGALSGAGNVTLGSNFLTVGDATNTAYSGVINGTGGLTKQGTGTLTMSGANTYTGGTTISAGTLALTGGGRLSTTGALTIAAGATFNTSAIASVYSIGSLSGSGSVILGGGYLTVGDTSSTNFSGDISSSGAGMNKEGSGTLTLTGSNNLTGNTWLNDGTLKVSNGGSVSSAIGHIAGISSSDTAVLTVDGSGSGWTNTDRLYVGEVGTGTLNIVNGGLVTSLSNVSVGTNSGATGTVTVDGNGSRWTSSGLMSVGNQGAGTLTIENGGKVETAFLGLGINGGSGTLNLDGITSARGVLETGYVSKGTGSGTVNWNGGTLRATGTQSNVLQGFAAGDVDIQSGGAFIDTQTYNVGIATTGLLTGVGGLTKQGTGTLTIAGGNAYTGNTTISAGILQFGSYSQNSSQTLGIGASSASTYGKLVVTGSATFAADSKISVDVSSVNTLAANQTLTSVVSAGTLNASTFNVTDNSALFNFNAVLNGNAVDLNVVANSSAGVYDSVIGERRYSAVNAARILDRYVAGTPTGDMSNVVNALGKLGTQREVARAAAQTLPVGFGTQSIQGVLSSFGRLLQGRVSPSGLAAGDALLNQQAWAKGFGSRADQDDRSGTAGFSADSWGLAFGADAEVAAGRRVGLAYGYAKTSVTGNTDLAGTAQNAGIDSHVLAIYGNTPVAADLDLVYQADVGLSNNKGTRHISFGGLSRTATSEYQTWSAHAGVGLNKTIALNEATTFVPGIRADYTYLRSQAYSETNADALNLNVGKDTTDAFILGADARLVHKFDERSSLNVIMGAGYDTINKQGNIVSTFAGTPGQAFSTPGIEHSPWLMRGGIGYSHKTTNGTDIALRYDAEGRSGFINQTVSIKATLAF